MLCPLPSLGPGCSGWRSETIFQSPCPPYDDKMKFKQLQREIMYTKIGPDEDDAKI